MVYFLNVCSKDDIFAETIQPNDKLLMVGVLGSDPSKSYPLKYLAEVLDHIAANRADLLLVFNFRPAQQILVDRLLSYCNDQTISKIKQNLYQKDIRLFLALLSKCVGLVSNEGGAVNMAKALLKTQKVIRNSQFLS